MLTMFRDLNTVGLVITILITTNTIECADGEFGDYNDYGYNEYDECQCEGDPCNIATWVCPSDLCWPPSQEEACDTVCPNGTYGSGCKERCGNCSGNDICDKHDGKCPGQCSSGYQGDMCTRETLEGPPAKCSLLLTISGWVFGGVTVLAAVGVFVLLKMRSRRAQRKPTSTDTSLYNIP